MPQGEGGIGGIGWPLVGVSSHWAISGMDRQVRCGEGHKVSRVFGKIVGVDCGGIYTWRGSRVHGPAMRGRGHAEQDMDFRPGNFGGRGRGSSVAFRTKARVTVSRTRT